jgi:signal transduction histidine kinase
LIKGTARASYFGDGRVRNQDKRKWACGPRPSRALHIIRMMTLSDDIAAVRRISAVPTILQVISESTGLGYALVARVTAEKWTVCAVRDVISFGLAVGDQLDVATTLCSEVRESLEPIVIEHASMDVEYRGHRTPKMYGFESYIAVPVFRADGEYFGTLCALDRRPAKLRGPKTLSMMKLFAELISLQLRAEEEHADNRAALAAEKVSSELREQFIAVLGHDLRNPLSSIVMGAELLLKQSWPESARASIVRIRKSAHRIDLLVKDLLDLARGRMGHGIPLTVSDTSDLEGRLRHVFDEVASTHPNRTIHFTSERCGTIGCDPQRVEQVLSNLLGNALEHGDTSEPVEVRLGDTADAFVLSVCNRGQPIPQDVLPNIFQPFYRRSTAQAPSGLGLGLFIVAQIAKSHGGFVAVTSSADEGTVFTFTLPRTPR